MHNAGRHITLCALEKLQTFLHLNHGRRHSHPPPVYAAIVVLYNRVHFPFFSSRFALQTMTGRNDRITDFRQKSCRWASRHSFLPVN